MISTTAVNGEAYSLPTATHAKTLANYPHARTIPQGGRTIFVSGVSSRRNDGTFEGYTGGSSEGQPPSVSINQQTAAVLRNIETIIKGATKGIGGLEHVVDATVFLVDIENHYKGMNEEWDRVWPSAEVAPTRTTVEVRALPRKEIFVEIKCTAILPDS